MVQMQLMFGEQEFLAYYKEGSVVKLHYIDNYVCFIAGNVKNAGKATCFHHFGASKRVEICVYGNQTNETCSHILKNQQRDDSNAI